MKKKQKKKVVKKPTKGKKRGPQKGYKKPPQQTSQGIAYVIKDKKYGEFEVKNTANAWWLEKTKVQLVIAAKKIGANPEMCCCHAGISKRQLEYFLEKHKYFCDFFETIIYEPNLIALNNIYQKMNDEKREFKTETSKWWLERKLKAEFSVRSELTGPDGNSLMDLTEKQEADIAKSVLKSHKMKHKLEKKLKGDKNG